MAADFVEVLTPAEAGDVAAGLAATALFVFGVAIASAAFFLVGIVAFRSVGAVAFGAAVLVEIVVAFGAGLAAFAGGVLVLAGALAAVGLVLTPVVLATAADALALVAVTLLVALAFSALGVAAVRARGVVATFAREAGTLVTLARLTDAAGCAAVRAAALDAATGLALRADDFEAGFAVTEVDLVVARLAGIAFKITGFVALAEVAFAGVALAEVGLVAAVFAETAFAGLRLRATGLVLGDMSASPGIGHPLGSVIVQTCHTGVTAS